MSCSVSGTTRSAMAPVAASRGVVSARPCPAASARPPMGFMARRQAHTCGFAAQTRSMRAPVRGSRVVAEANKVALLGAAGGIGQPLALLLKLNEQISELRLYDIANVKGVAADLSHINTNAKVSGHTGAEALGEALKGAELVIIPAGVPRKPGMTRDDLFNINAGIVRTLIEGVAKHCPEAIVAIISNPVNSTVPIAAETLKKAGVYDRRKVLGVTTLDVVRAETFVAENKGLDVREVSVPVVGGHAGETILPLLSQAEPKVEFDDATAAALTERIQNAGTEVVEAKAGAGSATLSMAYAAARFAESVLAALAGEKNVVECTFVESDIQPGFHYFSSKVVLGPNGVEEILPLGELNASEKEGLDKMSALLTKNIETGVAFANKA